MPTFRRLTIVLLALLTLGTATPVWADPTSDTLLLFGAMLAPLLNNAPPPRPVEIDPSMRSTPAPAPAQIQNVRPQPEPLPPSASAPPNGVLAPLSSPAVRRWSMNVMLGELVLTVVMGLAILTVFARNTAQLHRILKNNRSGRRRCTLR